MAARSLGYGRCALNRCLPDAELGLGFLRGHDARVPTRRPDQVDVDVVYRWKAVGKYGVGLGFDDWTKRAGRRGQRHVDEDVRGIVIDLDAVDQAKVDDADADLGVVDRLQSLTHLLLARKSVRLLCYFTHGVDSIAPFQMSDVRSQMSEIRRC